MVRKVLYLFVIIIFIVVIPILFFNNNQTKETPKILTELKDNGIVNGKREFVFSLKNVGEIDAELRFLTWLEYNFTLNFLGDQEDIIVGTREHIDLEKGNEEARTLLLKPNDRVDYRIHLNGFNKGKYEMKVSPAVLDYDLGVQKIQFVID